MMRESVTGPASPLALAAATTGATTSASAVPHGWWSVEPYIWCYTAELDAADWVNVLVQVNADATVQVRCVDVHEWSAVGAARRSAATAAVTATAVAAAPATTSSMAASSAASTSSTEIVPRVSTNPFDDDVANSSKVTTNGTTAPSNVSSMSRGSISLITDSQLESTTIVPENADEPHIQVRIIDFKLLEHRHGDQHITHIQVRIIDLKLLEHRHGDQHITYILEYTETYPGDVTHNLSHVVDKRFSDFVDFDKHLMNACKYVGLPPFPSRTLHRSSTDQQIAEFRKRSLTHYLQLLLRRQDIRRHRALHRWLGVDATAPGDVETCAMVIRREQLRLADEALSTQPGLTVPVYVPNAFVMPRAMLVDVDALQDLSVAQNEMRESSTAATKAAESAAGCSGAAASAASSIDSVASGGSTTSASSDLPGDAAAALAGDLERGIPTRCSLELCAKSPCLSIRRTLKVDDSTLLIAAGGRAAPSALETLRSAFSWFSSSSSKTTQSSPSTASAAGGSNSSASASASSSADKKNAAGASSASTSASASTNGSEVTGGVYVLTWDAATDSWQLTDWLLFERQVTDIAWEHRTQRLFVAQDNGMLHIYERVVVEAASVTTATATAAATAATAATVTAAAAPAVAETADFATIELSSSFQKDETVDAMVAGSRASVDHAVVAATNGDGNSKKDGSAGSAGSGGSGTISTTAISGNPGRIALHAGAAANSISRRPFTLVSTVQLHNDLINALTFAYTPKPGVPVTQLKPSDLTNPTLFTSSHSSLVSRFDVPTSSITSWFAFESAHITSLAFDAKYGRLFVGSFDWHIYVYAMPTMRMARQVSKIGGHSGNVRCIAFHSEMQLLASGSADTGVFLWRVAAPAAAVVSTKPVNGASGASDESEAAPSTPRSGVSSPRESSISSIAVLHAKLYGHAARVKSVAFSPDGRYVVSGDHSGCIIVWNVVQRAAVLAWQAHRGTIESVAFASGDVAATAATAVAEAGSRHPNTCVLSSGGNDRTAKMWSLDL